MKQKLLFLCCFLFSVCTAQQKVLQGKIVADTKDLSGITIKNLSLGKETSTRADGMFSIAAKTGDTLMFTAVQLKPKTIVVEKEDFDYLPYPVRMLLKITELNEIIVEKSNIDAVSLGIVPYKVKKFTPAERRYYTATTGSGILPIDPIINAITGRTKMLKKEIQVEKYMMIQAKLGNMFEAEHLMQEFNIPEDYLEGFVFFVSEKPKVMDAVKAKNKTLTLFLLGELAVEFNEMLADAK